MITTIYYSKLTSEIYTISTAPNKQDFRRFNEFEEDMKQILDIMYIKYNEYFENSYHNYKVVNGQLVLKEGVDTINTIEE